MMGREGYFFFLFKEILVCPMGFSHFSADDTVFYSSCIKLSVYALYVSLEDSEQMTETIARGRKNTSESISAEEISYPASMWTVPLTFSYCVLSHSVGRLY
jgi:hypothetical protein